MTGASIKSLGSGIGGAMVLVLFSTTFLTLEKVLFITPLFLAFTGAMIGFQLVETLRNRIRGRFVFPFVMGTGQGAAVFVLIIVLAGFFGQVIPVTGADLIIYILISGVTSYLGARLAAGYFKL